MVLGPQTEVTLPDPVPRGAWKLRPALWHATALICAGYMVKLHEFRWNKRGSCWRTWHVSKFPVISQSDALLANGSDELINLTDSGKMAERYPGSPYLAAFHAARNLDILLAYKAAGGPPPISVSLTPGRGPIARLVPSSELTRPASLAEFVRHQAGPLTVADYRLGAAMIALGFPFDRLLSPSQSLRLLTVGMAPTNCESVLCAGLTERLAVLAFRTTCELAGAAARAPISDAGEAEWDSPLPADHLFHWAVMGVLRRETLRALEAKTGSDSSPLRSNIFEVRSRTPGRAVIATAEEYRSNEEAIIKHLRRL